MAKIMVVDDDKKFVDTIKYNLENDGFEVFTSNDGENALKTAYTEKPDLIIIDVVLPRINGFDACKKLREFTNCPILILTYKNDEKDKVLGFEQGADDYITKPVGKDELKARINAHLRRYRFMFGQGDGQNKKSNHGLEVLPDTFEVKRDGETIELTQREFDLLVFLIQNSGKVYSREQLLELVWGFDYYGDVRTVDVTIHRLREKIEKKPSKAEYILTKRGFGYYFRRN